MFSFTYMAESNFILTGHMPSIDELIPEHCVRRYVLRFDKEERIKVKKMLFHERRTRAHLMPDYGTCAEVAIDYYLSEISLL